MKKFVMKWARPSPKPLFFPAGVAHWRLTKLIPENKRKGARTRILKALEQGCRIWIGGAHRELGLRFGQRPIRTVRQLMFVEPVDYMHHRIPGCNLGKSCVKYLEDLLRRYGLRIGMAVPPNDYD